MNDTKELARAPKPGAHMLTVSPGRPAYPVRAKEAFGISPGDWRALVDAVWPAAKTTEAVELALSYCRARNLDPFKRPVHIVPVWDSKKGQEVETIWPGIGELRTTASRTGQWAGNDEAVFGPEETRTFKGTVGKGQYAKEVEKTVTFPLWAQVTQYKIVQGQRVPFPGPRVLWLETYATMGASDVPNEMWATRPFGQLEKCAEAASLRRAFPEEVGSDLISDEIGKRREAPIDITPAPEPLGARTEALAERLKAERQPEPLPAAPVPATTLNLSRDELVEQIRAALAGHFTPEQKDLRLDALEGAFGTKSWVAVTRMKPEELQVGLAALTQNLDGLAAMQAAQGKTCPQCGEFSYDQDGGGPCMRCASQAERIPGSDDEEVPRG